MTAAAEASAPAPRHGLRLPPWRVTWLAAAFLAYDACSYHFPPAAGAAFTLLHGVAVLGIAAVNAPAALIVFVVSLVFADDIPRLNPYGGYGGLHNLLTTPVAGVAVGNYVALGLIAAGVLAALARIRRYDGFRFNAVDGCVVLTVLLYAAAALHGYRWLLDNPRGALNDLNQVVMATGFYVLVRLHAGQPESLERLWNWLAAAMAAKTFVWAAWFVLGIGYAFGGTLRVSFESGRILLVLMLTYGLLLQDKRLDVPRRDRLAALALAGAAAFNIFVNASRGPWIMAGYAFLVLFLCGSLASKVRWLLVGGVSLVLIVAGLAAYKPEAFTTLGYFANTLKFWEEGRITSSHSTMVRVHEFMNIHAQLADHGALVLGEGPGSHFTDRYHPFPFGLTEGDYSFAEIETRRFQNPHGVLQALLLNTGYAGLCVYLACMACIYWTCFESFMRLRAWPLKGQALCLLAFLPPLVYSAWAAKMNMLLGLFIGVAAALLTLSRQQSPQAPPAP